MRPLHPRARLKPVPTSAGAVEAEVLAETAFLALALRGALSADPAPSRHPLSCVQGETVGEFLQRVTTSATN